MLQEEHPFSLIYKIFLKMCLVYTSSWVHISTKFNGVLFFGLIMDVRLRRCWKNIKKVLRRVSKIACFLGPKYGRLKTGFGCHFQRLSPIEQHNTLNNFSCFMALSLKMLKRFFFLRRTGSKKYLRKNKDSVRRKKKCTFLAFSEVGP